MTGTAWKNVICYKAAVVICLLSPVTLFASEPNHEWFKNQLNPHRNQTFAYPIEYSTLVNFTNAYNFPYDTDAILQATPPVMYRRSTGMEVRLGLTYISRRIYNWFHSYPQIGFSGFYRLFQKGKIRKFPENAKPENFHWAASAYIYPIHDHITSFTLAPRAEIGVGQLRVEKPEQAIDQTLLTFTDEDLFYTQNPALYYAYGLEAKMKFTDHISLVAGIKEDTILSSGTVYEPQTKTELPQETSVWGLYGGLSYCPNPNIYVYQPYKILHRYGTYIQLVGGLQNVFVRDIAVWDKIYLKEKRKRGSKNTKTLADLKNGLMTKKFPTVGLRIGVTGPLPNWMGGNYLPRIGWGMGMEINFQQLNRELTEEYLEPLNSVTALNAFTGGFGFEVSYTLNRIILGIGSGLIILNEYLIPTGAEKKAIKLLDDRLFIRPFTRFFITNALFLTGAIKLKFVSDEEEDLKGYDSIIDPNTIPSGKWPIDSFEIGLGFFGNRWKNDKNKTLWKQ